MSKATIASVVGLIALVVGALFHIEITQDLQLQIVEVVGGLISVFLVIKGIITNHKNEQKLKKTL